MIRTVSQLLRITQWIKNLFVFVPLLFSLHLFHQNYFLTVFFAFIVFCFASSIVYIINDVVDREADSQHPIKKNRPIPSGKISIKTALSIAAVLASIIIIMLYFLPLMFIYSITAFLSLNLFYTFIFKHIVLLDIFSIAAGFSIRVIAGAFVINVEISNWLLLTTMFISLFLAVMKRYSELNLQNSDAGKSRKVLSQYSLEFTSQLSTVAAAAVIICYALYTVSMRTVSVFGTENLIYTTPFVVFGIFRYMFLVYMNHEGENTSKIMITDLQMIVTVILYITTIVFIVY